MEQGEINPLDALKPNHRRFVEAYCDCLNATEAYRRAGYSPKAADVNGPRLMGDDRIKAAISYRCEQIAMSAGEAVKQMSDIANTRLNDYMVIKMVLRTPTVKKGLQELINELQDKIDLEDEWSVRIEMKDDELERHKKEQASRERQIARYELELERNPNAFRHVDGEPQWVEEADIDLVALAKAKGQGRIKSLSFTEFGPKVELYGADAALDKILQLHGRYKQLPGDANQPKELTAYVLPDGTKIIF